MSVRPAARLPFDTSPGEAWSDGPHEPWLDDGETHVWRADLRQVGDELLGLLSERERERAARIVRPRERELWSRSRGVLKALLGRYTRTEPYAIQLVTGPHGKPKLVDRHAGPGTASPFFNISHSQHLALFAFSSDSPVGVDVQLATVRSSAARTNYVALAKRVFGASASQRLERLEPLQCEHEFLRMWTRHEAECKRRGIGIGSAGSDAQRGDGSSIVEFDAGPRLAAALSCSRAPGRLELWEWAD